MPPKASAHPIVDFDMLTEKIAIGPNERYALTEYVLDATAKFCTTHKMRTCHAALASTLLGTDTETPAESDAQTPAVDFNLSMFDLHNAPRMGERQVYDFKASIFQFAGNSNAFLVLAAEATNRVKALRKDHDIELRKKVLKVFGMTMRFCLFNEFALDDEHPLKKWEKNEMKILRAEEINKDENYPGF